MERDWALVVGIDRYPIAGVAALKGAVRDAKEFYDWVTAPLGGDVPKEHATLVTSPPSTAESATADSATAGAVARDRPRPAFADILEYFEDLEYRVGPDGRRLYIYLSGHGISPTGQQAVRNAALLMADAKPPQRWNHFPGNLWAEGIRSAALFQQVVLIMDCCRDLNNNVTPMPHIFGEPVEDSKRGILVEAFATQWASKARELALPPDNCERGVFTHSLLHVLRAGRMTGLMLRESVWQHLAGLLKDEKRAQKPEIRHEDDLKKGVFNENAATPRTPVVLKGQLAAPATISLLPEGGDVTPVALTDWNREGNAWRGTLEPGFYLVVRPNGTPATFRVFPGIPLEVVL